ERGQHVDGVGAVGAVDDDGIVLAVATARGAVEVQGDLEDVGSGQVIDGDRVGAAEGVEIDRLDGGEVHRDVGDVAGEPHQAAVGRDTDLLRVVRAVEDHPVGAGLPVDRVAAVAGVPDDRVAPTAQQGKAIAGPADGEVAPGAADEKIVPVA